MRWSEKNLPEARFIASVAVDTPFFPTDLVERLSEGCGRDENTVALAASTGRHSSGLRALAGKARRRTGKVSEERRRIRRCSTFADRFMRLNVPFDDIVLPNGEAVDPFFNVNTPEDARGRKRSWPRSKGAAPKVRSTLSRPHIRYQAQSVISVSSFTQQAGSLSERR